MRKYNSRSVIRKDSETIRIIECNSLYLRNKIASKNETK